MSASSEFLIVTERGGEAVSRPQLQRFQQRYVWAADFCAGRDVLEVACGTGPGLGYLQSRSGSLVAGDLSESVLAVARAHYGDRVRLMRLDAARTPFDNASFDVIILFEAIYYLPDVAAFAREARRLLRTGGVLLIATANKDLPDFNPSPFSSTYLNPPELEALFGKHGFRTRFLGGSPVQVAGVRSLMLQTMKRIAVALHLIPRSMRGKRFLKRLAFGPLVQMPIELASEAEADYIAPREIAGDSADRRHQVLYCVAEKMN